jgi:hypothetical protein
MSPVVESVILSAGFVVWVGLIIVGMSPELGARVGLWLRRGGGAGGGEHDQGSWRDWPGDNKAKDTPVEPHADENVGTNINMKV